MSLNFILVIVNLVAVSAQREPYPVSRLLFRTQPRVDRVLVYNQGGQAVSFDVRRPPKCWWCSPPLTYPRWLPDGGWQTTPPTDWVCLEGQRIFKVVALGDRHNVTYLWHIADLDFCSEALHPWSLEEWSAYTASLEPSASEVLLTNLVLFLVVPAAGLYFLALLRGHGGLRCRRATPGAH